MPPSPSRLSRQRPSLFRLLIHWIADNGFCYNADFGIRNHRWGSFWYILERLTFKHVLFLAQYSPCKSSKQYTCEYLPVMTTIQTRHFDWNEGERKVQSLLNVPFYENPTSPELSFHAARLCKISSLLALGTIDDEGRPWTTILSGQPGFIQLLGQSFIGVRAETTSIHDPVIELLRNDEDTAQNVSGGGRPMAALGIHLATRDRVKLTGSMIACNQISSKSHFEERRDGMLDCNMVFRVERSMGTYH